MIFINTKNLKLNFALINESFPCGFSVQCVCSQLQHLSPNINFISSNSNAFRFMKERRQRQNQEISPNESILVSKA